nr:MAG TPA: hypothetical protein [Caudoviricetes sp.]
MSKRRNEQAIKSPRVAGFNKTRLPGGDYSHSIIYG